MNRTVRENATMPCPCTEDIEQPKTDRYVSFIGIECDRKADWIMARVELHVADPARNNAFWDYFMKKRAGSAGVQPDNLFLIHSNINQVRELFETWDDAEGLARLAQLEDECC